MMLCDLEGAARMRAPGGTCLQEVQQQLAEAAAEKPGDTRCGLPRPHPRMVHRLLQENGESQYSD